MSPAAPAGLIRLRERVASIPARVEAWDDALAAVPPLQRANLRGVVATGAGSSGEHARLLVALLHELGLPARVAPPSAFLASAPPHAREELLVVFSQGLAPNARAALRSAPAHAGALLVTAALSDDPDPARADALAAFEAAGGRRVALPVEPESGLLVRVVGPMLAHLAAIALARALGAAFGSPAPWAAHAPAELADALRAASARAQAVLAAGPDDDPLRGAVALVAGAPHAARASHLSRKLLEGLLVPWPPVWDLLDFAHGGFQQLCGAPSATLLCLARADAPEEAALFARAVAMLDPARARALSLEAALPGPYALLEHEAMANELLLAALAARGGDPTRWPGQGRDAPLYELDALPPPEPAAATPFGAAATPFGAPATPLGAPAPADVRPPDAAPARLLARLAWPELARLLAAGARTAVVPLGSTEQHGAHLPFSTDTRIADALAARFCARVPEAVALPALALGCADEHLGFPGTLSLREETLAAVLRDVLASLTRAGFERAFVFSAHGGNAGMLRRLGPGLGDGSGLALTVFAEHGALADALFAEAARAGVDAAAAGHHAGELETSILLALAPEDVRRERAAAGRLDVPGDPQALFYPDLRANAPSGVVGDPARADAGRAARYLDAWVDVLVTHYERAKKRAQGAKKRAQANGTKKA